MLLVHVCCTDCLLKLVAAVVPRIEPDRQSLRLFFYNPNVHPEQEHLARQKAVRKLAAEMKLPLKVENWTPRDFFGALPVNPGQNFWPDKKVRCPVCFRLRLRRTFEFAQSKGYSRVTSTLLTSRYHDREKIMAIGREFEKTFGIGFIDYQVPEDCPKNAGFYKQNYEGCVFSLLERMREKYGGKLA